MAHAHSAAAGQTPLASLLTSSRLLAPPPASVFAVQFASLSLSDLEAMERMLASSPHNRQLCTGGDALNAALALLPRFEDAPRRAAALRIVRHLGRHRFTVHNTRFVLAAVARHLQEASDAAEGGGAAGTAEHALELLQFMGDVLSAAPGPADLPAFWDMGVGVLGEANR